MRPPNSSVDIDLVPDEQIGFAAFADLTGVVGTELSAARTRRRDQ